MTIRTKLSLTVGILIAGTVFVLGSVTYRSSRSAIEKSILDELNEQLAATVIRIEAALKGVDRDVLFLTEVPATQEILRGQEKTEVWRERLERIMSALLRAKPEYWQIRYIDERGWERVRVDSDGKSIRSVTGADLQNKSKEEYFGETMRLSAKMIYVSPLNLNRERGQIEVPYKPALRFATPVFDPQGNPKGIIIINLHARPMLDSIKSQLGNMYLVNREGFFLKHPDPRKEFGFDLETKFRLEELHPGLLDKAKAEDHGVEFSRGAGGRGDHIRGFKKIHYDPQSKGNFWMVVFDLPASTAFVPAYALRNRFLWLGLLITVLGAAAGFIWSGQFSKPMISLARSAERVATGDLTVEVSLDGRADELGTLAQTFRKMVNSLRTVTSNITESVNVLTSSAGEILAATSQVASGAAETATTVNETTSVVEGVKQTAQVTSQKAKYVSESARKSVQVSQAGKEWVEQTINGMNHIRDRMDLISESIVKLSAQSQAIGDIVASINDLTDQSNLLAVNAAIEAAKAGEQGRGFAVVAHEIKSLAEQSRQATVQVRKILNDIQKATSAAVLAAEQGSKAVASGLSRSSQTSDAIVALADNIVDAADAAIQIAASSQQQLAGTDRVALAMENIRQASAQNVAGTRQTENAAYNLHELGQKLKQMVEQYRV